jgi:hypothetical protein
VMDESLRLIESRVSRKAHYADRLSFKIGSHRLYAERGDAECMAGLRGDP